MDRWGIPLLVLTAAFLGSLPSFAIIGGKLEGKVFPVAGPAVIHEVYRFEDGWAYFSMSAKKRRDCNWRSTKFYLGDRESGNVPVAFEHLDKPTLRESGQHFWAHSRVQLTPDQLLERSHADVLHDCGWRLWTTKTPFYN